MTRNNLGRAGKGTGAVSEPISKKISKPLTWPETDIAWLAGLIEGEGYLSIYRHVSPYIGLGMKDEDIVLRAAGLTGARISYRRVGGSSFGAADLVILRIESRDTLLALIPRLLPYFGERRGAKAREMLRILTRRKEEESNYIQKVLLVKYLYATGRYSYRDLGSLAGKSSNGIRTWVRQVTIRSKLQNYDWAGYD